MVQRQHPSFPSLGPGFDSRPVQFFELLVLLVLPPTPSCGAVYYGDPTGVDCAAADAPNLGSAVPMRLFWSAYTPTWLQDMGPALRRGCVYAEMGVLESADGP